MFTANDDSKTITVGTEPYKPIGANVTDSDIVATSLTMNSLTIGKGTSVVMTGAFTGTVVVGDNSATFTAITGPTVVNSNDALVLTGSASIGTGQSMAVSAGTVSLGTSGTVALPFTVSSGTLKVASGATAKVVYSSVSIDKLNVAGVVEVPAGKTLTVTTQLDVTGTVSVTKATESATGGSLSVKDAYIGISNSDFTRSTSASASVIGPFILTGKMFVASDASIDQDMSSYKKTEVYNGGSLWFTAYAASTTPAQTMVLSKAPVTNAVLSGWATSDGGEVKKAATDPITIGDSGFTKIYSVVKTDIYTITILADEGVDNIYLNGNIMMHMSYPVIAYTDEVAAGTYTVTYTLKNGYSGEAKLALVDSDKTTASVSGMGVTVSGEQGEVKLQLTGIEKSGYTPVEPEKKVEGLTITEILLIVLVILVVIMAVVVALRLMRS